MLCYKHVTKSELPISGCENTNQTEKEKNITYRFFVLPGKEAVFLDY